MSNQSFVNFQFTARWVTRALSLISAAILMLFIFGGEESLSFPTIREMIGFGFFPVGILIGMALAWKWELLGGAITIVSLIGFYIWHFAVSGTFATGPYFLLFASPGILFFLIGLANRLAHQKLSRGQSNVAA